MLVLGIILVYMVMAAQFRSYMAPSSSCSPSPCLFRGVLRLGVDRQTLNIMSFIGLIMLVGTVVNNAIVLIDYINILLARDYSVLQAITMAGRQRLRPVMMTT